MKFVHGIGYCVHGHSHPFRQQSAQRHCYGRCMDPLPLHSSISEVSLATMCCCVSTSISLGLHLSSLITLFMRRATRRPALNCRTASRAPGTLCVVLWSGRESISTCFVRGQPRSSGNQLLRRPTSVSASTMPRWPFPISTQL